MENFKMDRTVVSKSTFIEADDHVTFYKDKTPAERLAAANYIINSIYKTNGYAKVDKTIVSSRKHVKHI